MSSGAMYSQESYSVHILLAGSWQNIFFFFARKSLSNSFILGRFIYFFMVSPPDSFQLGPKIRQFSKSCVVEGKEAIIVSVAPKYNLFSEFPTSV